MQLPNAYDTMRFLRGGIGCSVVDTGLTLADIMAGESGVTLVYRDDTGRQHRQCLDARHTPASPPARIGAQR